MIRNKSLMPSFRAGDPESSRLLAKSLDSRFRENDEARGQVELIGKGTHERFIISKKKFDEKMSKKKGM